MHSDVVLCVFVWFCRRLIQAQMGGDNIYIGGSFTSFFSVFFPPLLCLLNLFGSKHSLLFFKHTFGRFVLRPGYMLIFCQLSDADQTLRSPQLACLGVPFCSETTLKKKKPTSEALDSLRLRSAISRFQSASLERTRSC